MATDIPDSARRGSDRQLLGVVAACCLAFGLGCGAGPSSLGLRPTTAPVELGAQIAGTTFGAGNSRQPSCAPPGAEDVRYQFQAPSSGWFRFHVEAEYDSVLMLYRNGLESDCNDDAGSKRVSDVVVALDGGEVVELVVDGYGRTSGRFNLLVSSTEEPMPAHITGRLALDESVDGAINGEPDHFTPDCGSQPGSGDQVWQFVANEEGLHRFRVSAQYDSVVALYDVGGQQLACNDDHRGTSTSQMDVQLQAGTVYQVVVDGYGSNQGSYSLLATRLGVPAHGGTPGGGVLTVGQSVSHTTQGSTDRFTPGCGASAGSPDHVWELTPTEAGTLEIVLEAQYDGLLAVYDNQGTEIVCNDDDGPNRSVVVLGVAPGQHYRVVVDGYHGGQGAYQLVARPSGTNTTPTAPPSPDGTLRMRRPQAGDTTTGSDRLVPSCGARPGTPDQIWEFRATRTGRYRFHVDSQYDAVLALYDGNWGELECNDDHGSTSASEITTRLRRGRRIFVVVDGYGESRGSYSLRARRLSKRER